MIKAIAKNWWLMDNAHFLYDDLKKALPPIEDVQGQCRSHADIVCESREWNNVMGGSDWGHFYDLISDISFWEPFLERADFSGHDPLVDWTVACMSRECMENGRGQPDGRMPPRDPWFYPRLDIGYGLVGYGAENGGRGWHVDKPQRVLSGIWYFTSAKTQTGGELVIRQLGQQHEVRVPIEENRMILSLQTKDAVHMVRPVVAQTEPRIAAYFALSCSQPFWSDR